MDRFLTTEEVAEITRTSPSTVRYWRHTGKGPAGIKRGRRVLYPLSQLESWMSAGLPAQPEAVTGVAS